MYQDVLNLNKTTKSILKNPDPKASLAYSNSILRKDPSRVHSEGIGLNPNVPLEDEYIQNLQKQIHFMDLEIKLMKEKQTQEEALGGNYQFSKIGIADGKPSMDHIMTTTTKLKQMKIDLTKQINLLENELMKSREENTIAEAKLANLERHVFENDDNLGKVLNANNESLNQMKAKLLTERKAREDVEIEISKLKTILGKVLEENEKLRKETEVREINQRLAQGKFEQDEKFDGEASAIKKRFIDELQIAKTNLFMVIEKDSRLQALREENVALHEQLKKSEQNLDNTNYKVLETEALQVLSVKKKDEDQETRKKLHSELEKWRDQLDETIKGNELKVERKLREAESTQIKELQAVLQKERYELGELQGKLDTVTAKEKEYILDQANRIRYRDDLTKKRETNEALNKNLQQELKDLDPRVNDIQTVVEDLRLRLSDAREEKIKLQNKLTKVEEENISLLSRYQFMQNNIKLEDDMKKFNIEELKGVISTNQNVNETIKDFMEKWDFLKKFSKMG